MKNRKSTRGFTLVELSIVMAIVAILAVMIVSFTSLTSLRTKEASLRTDFMDAATRYRTDVTDGFAEIDTSGTFAASASGNVLTIGGKDFPAPDEIDEITVIAIDAPDDARDGILLRITVKNTKLSLEESFVIASHCGAAFTEGSGE